MAIPTLTKATEIDTLPGEEVEFKIGNAVWVMKQLSKLYSNVILAVIREYSTNARDSHIEAGMADVPIKVTLPSLYHTFFEVEDFGTGMSPDTMKEVYTSFGDSTKRGSNDTNGMLGFGSKSAMAYGDSFTVTSVCDGVETVALIARKPDWTISLKVISITETDKPNGTKISVPVAREFDAFRQVAKDFYRFWIPGTVEVDGEQPEWAVGEKIDDNLFYSTNPSTSYVVMGSVAYRITNPDALFYNKNMRAIPFVAYVDNGAVEFTPSREDLEYTDHTKVNLHKVIDDFATKMTKVAKDEIDNASDFFDAYTKWSYWTSKLGKGPFGELEFKGQKFVERIEFDGYRYRPAELRYNMYKVSGWNVSDMAATLIVTGMPGTVSSHHKSRARKYAEQKSLRHNYILFTEADKVESVWIDPKRVVNWETVKEATKPPKRERDYTNYPRRIKGTFDYYTKDGRCVEKPLPANADLYYITVQESKSVSTITALKALESDAVVVILAANRVEKFKRENNAKDFVAEFRKKINLNGEDLLTKDTKEALAVGAQTRRWLERLPLDNVLDPEFKRLKTLLADDKGLQEYRKHFALAQSLKMGYNFKQHSINQHDDSLIQKYPLIASMSPQWMKPRELSEAVIYINAKFKGN